MLEFLEKLKWILIRLTYLNNFTRRFRCGFPLCDECWRSLFEYRYLYAHHYLDKEREGYG